MLYFYLLIIIQIVLESFPVSSSGHVALLEQFLSRHGIQNELGIIHGDTVAFHSKAYDAVLFHFLHGPTIVVISLFFIHRWWPLLLSLITRWQRKATHYKQLLHIFFKIVGLTILSDSCTAFFYFLFQSVNINHIPIGIGFTVTAILLISLRWCPTKISTAWNWRIALLLGVIQGIALIPGISRFAATLVIGRWLQLAPHKAFEISLLIQWPLIAAGFTRSFWLLWYHGALTTVFTAPLCLSIVCASTVAYACLWLVAQLTYTNRLWWLGIYMVVPIVAWLMMG